MTIYAIHDSEGNVIRLEGASSTPQGLPTGLSAKLLGESVTAWPTVPYGGAVLRVSGGSVGILYWYDNRTVETTRAKKWEEIKSVREAKLNEPLVTEFGTFQADEVSRNRIFNLAQTAMIASSRSVSKNWRFTLANNSVVTLTTAQVITLGSLLGERTQSIFETSSELRGQVNEATRSKASIDEITWPS